MHIVSPTSTSVILLIDALRKPTSPADNSFFFISCGVCLPSSSTSYTALELINLILSPTRTLPSTTLINITTPLYGSK